MGGLWREGPDFAPADLVARVAETPRLGGQGAFGPSVEPVCVMCRVALDGWMEYGVIVLKVYMVHLLW